MQQKKWFITLLEKVGLRRKSIKKLQAKTMSSLLETIEGLSEIVKTQSDIIDALSLELLQGGVMTEKDLFAIKDASQKQEALKIF